MNPYDILLAVDDHLRTQNDNFMFKIYGIIKTTEMVLPFPASVIRKLLIDDVEQEPVVINNSKLLFREDSFGARFEIKASAEIRSLLWDWFLTSEVSISNYKKRLDFSICFGINIYKESGTHNLITTPGMIVLDGELYSTPEFITDLRPDIAHILPRGSMIKVFYLTDIDLQSVKSDKVIYDFKCFTFFLEENVDKETMKQYIAESIYQQTDGDRNSMRYLEIARIWVKDFLHRPPAIEVEYDHHSRRPNFLNKSM